MWVRGPTHPASGICATTDAVHGDRRLFSKQNKAILTSDVRPLGQCRLKYFAWEAEIDFLHYPFIDDSGQRMIDVAESHWKYSKLNKQKFRLYQKLIGTNGPDSWLPNIGDSDTIYVFGHCGSGEDNLQSWDHKKNISYQDVAGGLIAQGLPTNKQAKIKIFGCNSGHSSNFLFWTWQSFSQKFANEMYQRGFRGYRYFGYHASIRALYENIGGELHKGTSPGWLGTAQTVNSVREEFFPAHRIIEV